MSVGDGAEVFERLAIVPLTQEGAPAFELTPRDVLVCRLRDERRAESEHDADRQAVPLRPHRSAPDPLKVTAARSPAVTVTLRVSSLPSGHFSVTLWVPAAIRRAGI